MADQPVEELDGIHSEGYSDELDRILDDLADRISELEKDDDRWARRAGEGRPRAADARRVSAQELFTGAKSRAFELLKKAVTAEFTDPGATSPRWIGATDPAREAAAVGPRDAAAQRLLDVAVDAAVARMVEEPLA